MIRRSSKPQLPRQFASTLMLSGVLVLGAFAEAGLSAPTLEPSQPQTHNLQLAQQPINVPRRLTARVIREIAREYDVRISRLRVVEANRETWPNGCLGLPRSGEMCTQATVDGWRIRVTDNQRTWTYRTDATGRQLRLESQSGGTATLPESVRTRVLQEAARASNQPAERLSLVSTTRQDWPDRCLGLPRPTELCAPAVTPGWRVQVTDQRQTWTYRTDATGQLIRMESRTGSASLPNAVRDRVLRAASQESGRPVSALRVAAAEPQTWNGCFGLDPGPSGACTEIAIFGWRVLVTDGQQGWIYHTDSNGSQIEFNERASDTDRGLIPAFIPRQENEPPYLGANIVFRSESSGGIAGQTQTVTLMSDGRVILSRTATPPTTLKRLSAQQVRRFESLLAQQRFGDFNSIEYPAPGNAADYFTVTLVGRGSVVQYADLVQDQLPPDLQEVVAAWNEIARER